MLFSLKRPDWEKEFKDYSKFNIPLGNGEDADRTVAKYPVFHEGDLESVMYWRKQSNELIKLKNLDANQKFIHAAVLLKGEAKEKWNEAHEEVVGEIAPTDVRFRNTLQRFIQLCGATNNTASDLQEFILNARKPSNMKFHAFKT
jgi:hypothetical protein